MQRGAQCRCGLSEWHPRMQNGGALFIDDRTSSTVLSVVLGVRTDGQALLLRNPLDRTHGDRRSTSRPRSASRPWSAIRIAIRATRTPSTASRKSTRPTRSSKTPTSARPMTVSATPHSSRAWAAGGRLRRRFRHHLLRSVRRHFRHGRRARPQRHRPRARRRSALQHGDQPAPRPMPARMRKSAFRPRSPARRAPAPAPRPAPSRRPARCAAVTAGSATPKASSRWSAPARIARAAASRSTAPARHAPAPAASPASALWR